MVAKENGLIFFNEYEYYIYSFECFSRQVFTQPKNLEYLLIFRRVGNILSKFIPIKLLWVSREVSSTVYNPVSNYSRYKNDFTAQILNQEGLFHLKPLSFGRKNDAQIRVKLWLFKKRDIILEDKIFWEKSHRRKWKRIGNSYAIQFSRDIQQNSLFYHVDAVLHIRCVSVNWILYFLMKNTVYDFPF